MLGLVLSAFSISGLIAGPVMGRYHSFYSITVFNFNFTRIFSHFRWSDLTGNTKLVILVSNVFEIGGSFMYFVGISGWFLVASRIVCGRYVKAQAF